MDIHPTAIVSEKAKLAKGVQIGPYALIEDDVQIASGVKVYSHAQILNHTTIGEDCQIHMGAVLGHLPQVRAEVSAFGRLIIGQRNIFREYATAHRSSQKEGATTIGNDNYFMGFSHIAHDCSIGNNVTICNGSLIAGHVRIYDYAFISGNVTVHQFCRIGEYSMIGGLSRVAKDIPPYMLVKGDSNVWAVNSVGLRRAGFSNFSRSQIKKAFRLLYKSSLNVKQAVVRLQSQANSKEIKHLINFIQHSERGICSYKTPSIRERLRLNIPLIKGREVGAYRLFLQSRQAQEPLALVLLFVLIILLVIFLNRPLKEKLQEKYYSLFEEIERCLN